MLNLKQTIVVRHENRLGLVIVTVRGKTYGSLEIDKLAQLRADLDSIQESLRTGDERVIVDLSGIAMLGSAFLSELFIWLRKMGKTSADVIICGDQTGLLKLCATDRWVTVRGDLAAAINELCVHATNGLTHRETPVLACC
jgi:ABC-type transporter Mla MlaB component